MNLIASPNHIHVIGTSINLVRTFPIALCDSDEVSNMLLAKKLILLWNVFSVLDLWV